LERKILNVVMFIIAILAALYPAFSAARLVPAQGMRAT
jgi:ABC-type lipoprotein release transport system permease subunit